MAIAPVKVVLAEFAVLNEVTLPSRLKNGTPEALTGFLKYDRVSRPAYACESMLL